MQFDSSSDISQTQCKSQRKLRPLLTTQIFAPFRPVSPSHSHSPQIQQLTSQQVTAHSPLHQFSIASQPLLSLRNLSFKYNRLSVLRVEDCGLRDLSGLATLNQLTEGHFQLNFISDISGMVWNKKLGVLDLKDNDIEQMDQLMSLSLSRGLRAVRLEGNPITKIQNFQSQIKILNLQPIIKRKVNRQLQGYSKAKVDQLFKANLAAPLQADQATLTIQKEVQEQSFQLRTLVNFGQLKRQESVTLRSLKLTTEQTSTSEIVKHQKSIRTGTQSALLRHKSLIQKDSVPLSYQRKSFVYFCNDSHKKAGISPLRRQAVKRPATASRPSLQQNRSIGKVESFRKQPQKGEKLKRSSKKGVGLLYCQGLL